MMAAKVLGDKEVTREDRRQFENYLKLYFTQYTNSECERFTKLEGMINCQKSKIEEMPAIAGTDYSSKGIGSGGGKGLDIVDKFQVDRSRAKSRYRKLKYIKMILDSYLAMLDQKDHKILKMFYNEEKKYTVRDIASVVSYSEDYVKERKRIKLDWLIEKTELMG